MTQHSSASTGAPGADLSVWLARLILLGLLGLGLAAAWWVRGLDLGRWRPESGAQATVVSAAEGPTPATESSGPPVEIRAEIRAEIKAEAALTDAGDLPTPAPSAEGPEPPLPEARSAATQATAFEDAPGVLGVSIRTLRRESIKAYSTESLGVVALGFEDLGLAPTSKDGHVEVNLEERIAFEGSGHAIPKKSRRLLDGIGRLLAENPDTRVQIRVHTDDQGDSGFNLRLTQRRAESLVQYLVGRGVAAERIEALGLGESAPLVSTGKRTPSRQERAKNRRIELSVEHLAIVEPEAVPSGEDDAEDPSGEATPEDRSDPAAPAPGAQ